MTNDLLAKEIEKLSLFCLEVENRLTGEADFKENPFHTKIRNYLRTIRSEIDGIQVVLYLEMKGQEIKLEDLYIKKGTDK